MRLTEPSATGAGELDAIGRGARSRGQDEFTRTSALPQRRKQDADGAARQRRQTGPAIIHLDKVTRDDNIQNAHRLSTTVSEGDDLVRCGTTKDHVAITDGACREAHDRARRKDAVASEPHGIDQGRVLRVAGDVDLCGLGTGGGGGEGNG